MNGLAPRSPPPPMMGDPTGPQGFDPARRLVWQTFDAVLREELAHHRPYSLRPAEVMEAFDTPPPAPIGKRQTLLRFQGPPMEQPGVRPGSTVDPGRFVVSPAQPSGDEGRAPPQRVEYADGTWSWQRPDGVALGERRWLGPVLYEYLGQVRQGPTDERRGELRWEDVFQGYEDNSPRGQIIGASWRDSHGGEWVAVNLDEPALARRVAEYDSAMRMATGIDEEPAGEGLEWVEEEGGFGVEDSSHTVYGCDGLYYTRFGDDDRRRQATLTDRQKAAALVKGCGGFWIDRYSVLTAAHCIGGSESKEWVDRNTIHICSQGNAYPDAGCADAGRVEPDIYAPARWWKQPSRDLAVVVHGHDTSVDRSHTTMWVSYHSDETVRSYQMHNIANPVHAPLCTDNTASPVSSVADASRYLTHALGPIVTRSHNASHRWEIDGGELHSGTSVYFCGDDRCDSGETALAVSVWSGRYYPRVKGPKLRKFRSWVLSLPSLHSSRWSDLIGGTLWL